VGLRQSRHAVGRAAIALGREGYSVRACVLFLNEIVRWIIGGAP